MRHCFGPKRRSNRRDGEKTCWRSRLGVAYLCTKWRMVTHRGTRGNSRSRLKNRRKIGDWLGIPEFPPAAGSLPAEQGALCAADSLACGLEVGIHANFGRALKHHPIFRYGGGAAETTDQADRAQDRAIPSVLRGSTCASSSRGRPAASLYFFL
jgi:hypothetical protein